MTVVDRVSFEDPRVAGAVMTWPQWLELASKVAAKCPGTDFGVDRTYAYYEDLCRWAHADVAAAIRACLPSSSPFAPGCGEILGRLQGDPGRPTFDEAFELIFGRGGLLSGSDNERYVLFAARRTHPLLEHFIASQGYRRLRMLEVHDPDDGHWRVKELREAWAALEVRADEREAAGLELGAVRPRRVGPGRLDPAGYLPAAPRELGPGGV